MLVEKKISSKINYEVLRGLETIQSIKSSQPVTLVPQPAPFAKQEFLVPRVPTRIGGKKRLVFELTLYKDGCTELVTRA